MSARDYSGEYMSNTGADANVDPQVAAGFGDEWTRFDQSELAPTVRQQLFESYFAIFPWDSLPSDPVGADFGCGSGRWATLVAPRVARLYCVDASSSALKVAQRNLVTNNNCEFIHASIGSVSLPENCLDFAYSLGVLHHVPDTAAGIRSCVKHLKQGAPFLLYLYYRFDNRPFWYRTVWGVSNAIRAIVSRLPFSLRYLVSQVIALTVYWPLARLARMAERLGIDTTSFPLSFYRDKPLYVMRTDALDRFGTRLEKRFTRAEIEAMMRDAGLTRLTFSATEPYWCVVGFKA